MNRLINDERADVSLVQKNLDRYGCIWPKGLIRFANFDADWEQKTLSEIQKFWTQHPNGLERSSHVGHITGSALVVNQTLDRVLLTLHAKLGKWLQLGGHVDGSPDIARAALREAREESGCEEVKWLDWETVFGLDDGSPAPLDIDIHEIPARKTDPAHFHYDIRYLCLLDDRLPLRMNEESKDLRWLSLAEAKLVTTEESMLRQFAKLQAIREKMVTQTGRPLA